jgi:hypothetical protein
LASDLAAVAAIVASARARRRDGSRRRVLLGDGGTGRAGGATDPLGAQRRCVRERKDVPSGDRDVGVVRKSGVTGCHRDSVGERDGGRHEGHGRRGTALAEAGALRAALWGGLGAWRVVRRPDGLLRRRTVAGVPGGE